jgi:hypothetical protein
MYLQRLERYWPGLEGVSRQIPPKWQKMIVMFAGDLADLENSSPIVSCIWFAGQYYKVTTDIICE